MKNSFLKKMTALTVAALVLVMSCSKDEDPSLSVAPSATDVVFSADGTILYSNGSPIHPLFTVATNQSDWKAESNQGWLTVTMNKAAKTFTLSADKCTSITSPDEAKVTITAGSATPVVIKVTQTGLAHSLSISPSHETVVFSIDGTKASANGKEFPPEFTVTTNVGDWNAVSDKPWLTVDPDKASGKFRLIATANTEAAFHASAKVTVTAGTATPIVFTVNQEDGVPYLNLSSTEDVLISSTGKRAVTGTFTYTVDTNVEGWEAVSDEEWLIVDQTEDGFTIEALKNPMLSISRSATVTVSAGTASPKYLNITQRGLEYIDITNSKLSNTIAPFEYEGEPIMHHTWGGEAVDILVAEVSSWPVKIWKTNDDAKGNGNVWKYGPQAQWHLGFSVWYQAHYPIHRDLDNAKIWQTVDLAAGEYQLKFLVYTTPDFNYGGTAHVVAAVGEELPNFADFATGALSYSERVPDNVQQTNVEVATDFLVDVSGRVSLGIVAHQFNTDCLFSRVILLEVK